MIEINLLPEEVRVKTRNKNLLAGFDLKYAVYAVPAAIALLICVHLLFGAMAIIKQSQLSALNKKWQSMGPERKALEEFNKEYTVSTQDASLIKPLMEQRISWSQKLNRLSLDLPSGIWFTDISVNAKELNLRGSVVSPEKLEMSLIKKFIDMLKDDAVFFKEFVALELGPIQSKVITGNEVANFTLKGTLKTK
jgi:Tfp pilus assembly protein PilN